MKKTLFLFSFVMLFVAFSQAQDSYLKTDFMAGYSSDDVLEKGDPYADKKNPIVANTWKKSSEDQTKRGGSPKVVGTLARNGYLQKDYGISLDDDGSSNLSVYSLTDASDFSSKAYYLAFLINYSTLSTTTAQDIVCFSAGYAGDSPRGKLFLIEKEGEIQFSMSVGGGAAAAIAAAGTYAKDATHLVIMKYDRPNKTVSVFINPETSTGTEPTPLITETIEGNLLAIKGITLRKRPGFEGVVGSFRLAETWVDAAGFDPADSIDSSQVEENKEIDREEYYDVTGRRVDMSQAKGIVIKKTIYTDNTVGVDKVMVK